ncbi:MAG: hypothetical protein LBB56_08605, partial [Chitinispirillales bacterium]|nr:hypothetical protein [Chitinispirillales bacterium]
MFLKRGMIFLFIVFSAEFVLAQSEFVRPLPPISITAVSSNKVLTVTVKPANNSENIDFQDIRHDVLLVSDFTISLNDAFNLGKEKNSGPCVSDTIKTITNNNGAISFNGLKDSSRYFFAARTSAKVGERRINSGWRIYSDTNGVPVALSIGESERLTAQ